MATLEKTNPTLLDIAKSKDPDGKTAAVVEILNQSNTILDDMTFINGNLDTGHQSTIRAGLPDTVWSKLYEGIPNTKSTRVQVTDTTGRLETQATIDTRALELSEDKEAFMMSENSAFMEAMSQEVANTLFTGNESTDPEEFTGLTPRYSDATAENADNIIDGGSTAGSTDNASIWLIGWSPETITGIVPKGSKAGLIVDDMGKQLVQDASGNDYTAMVTRYEWQVGLAVRDWRYAVRICNIDRSTLTSDATSGADLNDLMDQAFDLIPNMDNARFSWYMDRDILGFLRRQSKANASSTLTVENLENGKMITRYGGVPLKRTDALHVDEARVTGL